MNLREAKKQAYDAQPSQQNQCGEALGGYEIRPSTPVDRFRTEHLHTLDKAKRMERAAEILARHPEFEELLELIDLNVI